MINTILTTIINILIFIPKTILNIIGSFISTVFPDSLVGTLSSYTSTFISFLSQYIASPLTWFFDILPPITKSLILIYLQLLLIFFTIGLYIHAIIYVIDIIKRVNLFSK